MIVVVVDVVDISVVVDHRPDIFLQVLGTLPCREGSVDFFKMIVFSCFAEKSGSRAAPRRAGLPAQRRLATAATRHHPASLFAPPP